MHEQSALIDKSTAYQIYKLATEDKPFWDVSGVTGCVSLLVFLRVPLPAPSRSQVVVQPDEPTWRSLWAHSSKWWPRRSSCLNPVSREFSVSQTSGIKAKLPAPTTTSAFSRSVMSNSEIVEKKSPRSVLSTNLQLSWALMDFGSKFSVPVENDGESDKRTCCCPNVYICIYIHIFLYRRHYRFYPPDLFVCGLNPHMFFQSGDWYSIYVWWYVLYSVYSHYTAHHFVVFELSPPMVVLATNQNDNVDLIG